MHGRVSFVFNMEEPRHSDPAIPGQIEPTPSVTFANLGHSRGDVGRSEYAYPNELRGLVLKLPLDCDVGKLRRAWFALALNPKLDFRAMGRLSDTQQIKRSRILFYRPIDPRYRGLSKQSHLNRCFHKSLCDKHLRGR